MDAERSGGAMTDTAIDREIQAALTVDPSPEFLARVRTRIATEPAQATPWLSWKFVAAGAFAAAIATAVVVSRPEGTPTPVRQASGAEDVRLPPPAAIEQPRRAETAKARTRAWRAGAPEARRRPEPEILLDPAETRALRRLIAGTRDGSLDLSASLQATTPTAMDLPPIDAIVIAPLTIDPLTPSGEEGVRP
jgi:hypothetical protein